MRSISHELLVTVVGGAIAFGLCGCGGKPGRFDYSGQVLFDGKPVPAGEVIFAPDTGRQNRGPGSVAKIKDGRYETPKGKGIVGGPHIVRITGLDGIPPGPGEIWDIRGKPLFRNHEMRVDFPRQSGTHDFEVPATAKSTIAK